MYIVMFMCRDGIHITYVFFFFFFYKRVKWPGFEYESICTYRYGLVLAKGSVLDKIE